ncbi:histone deacetylase family protein [Zavarzinia sp. CC-PAN008]|uniref:histone deacetylase family protein n=1 Tax=Zavarzinia sp. CC-PAN008 TaxID=3243332 RepID=UPI003F744ED2
MDPQAAAILSPPAPRAVAPPLLPLVFDPGYVVALPEQHRFPMPKAGLLVAELTRHGLTPTHRPRPAPRAWLTLVHDAAYVDAVLDGTLDAARQREIGVPLTPPVIQRARLAVGGTVLAANLALDHGQASNTAGGSHHAHAARGAGFCIFNDVAVAIACLRARGRVRRVAVVDLDVHQGDGTAALFADDPDVATLSLHAQANFPVRKQRSTLDVGLADGLGDSAYLEILERHLGPFLERAAPDIVFYLAGVDVHADDPLGRLALSDQGIAQREALVVAQVRGRGLPLVTVVGGGYDRDRTALARRHALAPRAAWAWACKRREETMRLMHAS